MKKIILAGIVLIFVSSQLTAQSITGIVFEDKNYGGGSGRNLATSSGVGRGSARVELYNSTGTFVSFTTTATSGTIGQYSFSVTSGVNYTIRVVNATVTSARTGYTTACLPVQTYRTTVSGNTVTADVNRVGGEAPEKADAAAGAAGNTIAGLTTGTIQPQSLSAVTAITGVVSGVDFGFNFNTIVNKNNTGLGSLRQFLASARLLTNTGLAQVGQTPGVEATIFMIPDGLVHAGLRAGLVNQLTSGVAIITITTLLPTLIGSFTNIDGTTQTANVGNTNSGTLGTGGTVGTDNITLPTVEKPEVQIVGGSASVDVIFEVAAPSITIKALAMYGNVGNYGSIWARTSGPLPTGLLVQDCIIGSSATSFTDPGATRSQGIGIAIGYSSATIINNLIGFNGLNGIYNNNDRDATATYTIAGNEIRGNGILLHATYVGGILMNGTVAGPNFIQNNLFAANKGPGLLITCASCAPNMSVLNNTFSGNGISTHSSGFNINSDGGTIDRNIITGSYGAGLLLSSAATQNIITKNSIYSNGSIPSQIGIDLLSATDAVNLGTSPFVTLNDNADADVGGNDLINSPVIYSAVISGANLIVTGYARPGSVIELFISDNNSRGFGSGQTFLATFTEGSVSVPVDNNAATGTYSGVINGNNQGTDAANFFSFVITKPASVSAGTILTATATISNNTSEFSGNITAVLGSTIKIFTGTGNFSEAIRWTYGTVPVAGDSLIIDGACTVDNNAGTDNIVYGTLTIGTAISRTLNWAAAGTNRLNVSKVSAGAATSTLDMTGGGNLIIRNSWTSTNLVFTYGGGTIEFQSTMTLPIAYSTYNNLTVNGAGATVSINASTVLIGDLTITAGTATPLGLLTVGDAVTIVTGTFDIGANVLKIGGAISSSGTFTVVNGTIEMNGSSAQSIPASIFTGNIVKNLIINNSAGVTLSGLLNLTELLTVSNGSLASNGYLTLKSTATGTARVGEITSGAATPISGNVIAERYIPGRRKYRLITSPVTTSASSPLIAGQESQSIWGNWQNGGNNSTPNVGTQITGGSNADGFDTPIPAASLFTYNITTSSYTPYTTANGKNTKYSRLEAGVAYFMFVYGDRINSVSATNPNNTSLIATGLLKTGNQVYNGASAIPLAGVTGKFTLLGNPFASPIDWATITKTGIENTYWGWDPNLNNTGGYISITTLGSLTLKAPHSNSTGLDQNIQSGQGFFVRTSAAAPVLTIREQDKVSNFNGLAFRTEAVNNIPLLAINLHYDDNGNQVLADGVLTAFDPAFFHVAGAEDAIKMANSAENIAILNEVSSLSVDARTKPLSFDTIFLNISGLTRSQYTLKIFTQQMESDSIVPYLQDSYLNTMQSLSLTDTNNFTVNIFPGIPASFDINRFRIVFRPLYSLLPLKYISIKAKQKEKDVQVEWETAEEEDIQHYEIERSADGFHFNRVGEVAARGNLNTENYSWLDKFPITGNSYYRVRAIESNGKSLVSKIVVVRMDEVKSAVRIFPNPVKDHELNISIDKMEKGKNMFWIYNSQGQQVLYRSIEHPGGAFTQRIHLSKSLPGGTYYLQITNEREEHKQAFLVR